MPQEKSGLRVESDDPEFRGVYRDARHFAGAGDVSVSVEGDRHVARLLQLGGEEERLERPTAQKGGELLVVDENLLLCHLPFRLQRAGSIP